MKIGNHEIQVVIIEITKEGTLGDCYDDFNEFKKEKPDCRYRFGYCVVDTRTGYIPDECNDWNDSVDEALMDYYGNCADGELKDEYFK